MEKKIKQHRGQTLSWVNPLRVVLGFIYFSVVRVNLSNLTQLHGFFFIRIQQCYIIEQACSHKYFSTPNVCSFLFTRQRPTYWLTTGWGWIFPRCIDLQILENLVTAIDQIAPRGSCKPCWLTSQQIWRLRPILW